MGLDLGIGNESGGIGTVEIDGEAYELLSSEKSAPLQSVPFTHVEIKSQGATANKWHLSIHGTNYNTLLRLAKEDKRDDNLWA